MDLIIDFYKGLDTLNLIIFWGIIIVIILLLVFSLILTNKNKKLKRMIEKKYKNEEEIPIKKEELIKDSIIENKIENENKKNTEEQFEKIEKENNTHNSIQTEKKFVAEELVSEYQIKENIPQNNQNKLDDAKQYQNVTINNFEIPNKPYQRNVLREMSLSQTSPIGINRINTKDIKEDKKIEMIKDLEDSLNDKNIEIEETHKPTTEIINNTLPQEILNVKESTHGNTEIKNNSTIKVNQNNDVKEKKEYHKKDDTSILKVNTQHNILEGYQDISKNENEKKEKKASEKYLEEVSRKLAEAEVTDEIERTNYELQQEEDAIISYKELMEKKDSIQTIDEEEAVISIEELLNRANKKEETSKSDARLYNLSEEEANDNFIKELKQFRNDL